MGAGQNRQVADPGGMNRALVAHLKEQGHIRTPAVEKAFLSVPRHVFLPGHPLEEVYADQAVMTKRIEGIPVSSSSQPAIMAEMLEQLEARPAQSVLEIGAGTGYNAALVAKLVGDRGSVVSVDIDADLVAAARGHLEAARGERVKVVQGDGGYGYAPQSPYDRIIVTVGTGDLPAAWREQLKAGGRLVVPLVLVGVQASIAFVRQADRLESAAATCCGFMPMRGAFAVAPTELASIDQPARWEETLPVAADPRSLVDGFQLWVASHEPGYVLLRTAERAYSFGVRTGDGAAAIIVDGAGPPRLRTYGGGESARRRLLKLLGEWGHTGCPGVEQMRVTALAAGVVARPRNAQVVLRRPSTTLVLSYA
jgi:protein-L-isoaspartate(D-aspartate) O-methyltransferase